MASNTSFNPVSHDLSLASLRELREGRSGPLPIELLAAGGPKALREWLRKGTA